MMLCGARQRRLSSEEEDDGGAIVVGGVFKLWEVDKHLHGKLEDLHLVKDNCVVDGDGDVTDVEAAAKS